MEVAFRVDYVQDLLKISTANRQLSAGREGLTVVPDEMSKGRLELAKEMTRWL